jgi:hypothetical protein
MCFKVPDQGLRPWSGQADDFTETVGISALIAEDGHLQLSVIAMGYGPTIRVVPACREHFSLARAIWGECSRFIEKEKTMTHHQSGVKSFVHVRSSTSTIRPDP